ncbi:MAG: pantoate--beta-alanine ligase [Alphaproteobacteria bacterium]|nr:pantoate--beta-alanine ligase [Alphaproteobacteria bacterium]
MPDPVLVRSVADLRAVVHVWRREGLRVALVPTMGALHEGHLSLVRLARMHGERVVASLFVNPKQFSAHEDLDRYPRDEAGDAAKLGQAGCDLLFAPPASEIYPPGFATAVTVSGVSDDLEGAMRPHFFGGVATVVTKLLLQCLPDAAVFGEKDYQQLLMIRRLVRDLDIPVAVVAGPTVREGDGLAMSSRNAYLSANERSAATQMNVILKRAVADLEYGGDIAAIERDATMALDEAGFNPIDYVAVRDAGDLSVLGPRVDRPARILAAAWLGKTRLIDNFSVLPRAVAGNDA